VPAATGNDQDISGKLPESQRSLSKIPGAVVGGTVPSRVAPAPKYAALLPVFR
jgi:hypothetical protein